MPAHTDSSLSVTPDVTTPSPGITKGQPKTEMQQAYWQAWPRNSVIGKEPLVLSPGCRLKQILLPLNLVHFQSDPENSLSPKPGTDISVSVTISYVVPYSSLCLYKLSTSNFYTASPGSAALS